MSKYDGTLVHASDTRKPWRFDFNFTDKPEQNAFLFLLDREKDAKRREGGVMDLR